MTSQTSSSFRFLNRDGSFNVVKDGNGKRPISDIYHILLSVSWPRFFILVAMTYLTINLFFAVLYFLCGPEALEGVRRVSMPQHFLDCFFFSVQTFATIGYGRISPVTLLPNLLVTFEALVGLLSVALMTGLFFVRFSKPTARVIFSTKALINKEGNGLVLMFRISNERLNQISEAHLNLVLVKNEISETGERYRKIYDLKLERNHSPIFALSWTVVHPIDKESPFYGKTLDDLKRDEIEILVTLTGTDETFSQSVNARFSYNVDDILWGAHFEDMVYRNPDGKIHIDLSKINSISYSNRA